MQLLEFEIKMLRLFICGVISFIALSSACGFAPMKKVEVPETRVAGPESTTTLTEMKIVKKLIARQKKANLTSRQNN